MNIVILGASGKTGTHLVRQALAGGHMVTAFVRQAGRLRVNDPKLRVAEGDARNPADLTTALKGQDAVLCAIGSNKPGDDLITQATKALLAAMQLAGVKRIIMLSTFLASPNFKRTGIAKIIGWLMQSLVKDKTSGEALLQKSDLDWTLVYATRLDGAPVGEYHVLGPTEVATVRNGIARADVAKFMLEQLDNPASIHKQLTITSK